MNKRKLPDNTPKKAIKVRIYPNKDQAILLYKTFGCCRKIFNSLLELQQKKLPCPTEAQFKVEFPYMTEVDSIALQQSRINLQQANNNHYKSLKGLRKGPKIHAPKFKSKKIGKFSYKTMNVTDNIKIDFDARQIKLPKIGWIKFRDPRVFSTKIKSVTVSRDPAHRFYASILIDKIVPTEKIQPSQIQPEKVIGYDMSLEHFTVNDTGKKLDYPRNFRKYEDKLAWEQRKLSRKQKGSKTQKSSNKYQKQKIKVAKVHAKIADSRNDFLQKLSTQITNEYDLICTESLNMHAMAQSLNLGKSVNDVSWGMFTRMLDYKIFWKGKHLIKIDKWFPSSKTCSKCGYINKGLTLDQRSWVCPECGAVHDRDINAAVNVRVEGIRIFNETHKGTVGTTGTELPCKGQLYAQGDCVRPVHLQDPASGAMSCTGSGH
jgi:putative transposase